MPNIPGLNAARVRFFDDGHRVLPLTKLTERDSAGANSRRLCLDCGRSDVD
ncbi:MAG: hypothetical protein AAES65_01000 [Candidatus Thiodiazotropha sp. (ex. Lucinoma kazani)]